MNLKLREKNPTNANDRQRRLIGSSHIRIFLTVTFIVNLLIVFRLIQPGQHSLLLNQLDSLVPSLMNSALFFLVLASCSLGGLLWYVPELNRVPAKEQAVKNSSTKEAPIYKGKGVSFDPELAPAQIIPLRQVAANV